MLAIVFSVALTRSAAAAPMMLSAGGGALSLTLDQASLAYEVGVRGRPWFNSGGADAGYAFSADGTTFSLAKHSLQPVGVPVRGNGTDASGAFASISVSFARAAAADAADAEWTATFKAYRNRPALVFAQHWAKPVGSAKGGSTFPSLRQIGSQPQLGTLEYTGASCGFMVGPHAEFPGIAGGSAQGYTVIAPRDTSGNGTEATLAIGPVTEHFANQARNEENSLVYGIGPTFESVPEGYELETVLVASTLDEKEDGRSPGDPADPARASIASGGVNGALMTFGDFLLARHNKTRARGDHNQETAFLGYSTTGFYFYNLCDCLDEPRPTAVSGGKPDPHNRQTCSSSPIPARFLKDAATPGRCASYADTLIAANAALQEQGIPIKHVLLDSWWYGEGWNGGAALWEDVPACTGNDTSLAPDAYPGDTFPLGLKTFRQTIGVDKALWGHNGLWSATSPYREKYSFADGAKGEATAPQGSGLWQHLFSENAKWGFSTIKQDHVRQQVDAMKSSYKNVTVLKSWMAGLGEGASANGVGVLYCCAEPNIHMNGVTVPAAYAVRSSPDYVGGGYQSALHLPTVQWAIGPDAAFHWNGLGLLPYKDTFISNSSSTQQSGRSWSNDTSFWPPFAGYTETGAATHALMSLLSMAHVTFGDAVGETNATLIKQLVRADGLLLKADRPVTAIDAQFQAMLFGAWPGKGPGPDAKVGSLFTMPCSAHSAQQQWSYVCDQHHCALKAAPGNASRGCLAAGSDCGGANIGAEILVSDNCAAGLCPSQDWILTQLKGSKGVTEFAIQSAVNSSAGQQLCLELRDGGAELAACNPNAVEQGWLASTGKPGTEPFTLRTPWHDDPQCLTASRAWKSGAFTFDSEAEMGQLADELFKRTAPSDRHQLTDQYRAAYTASAGLERQIAARQAQRGAQCGGKLGSVQGPLGEVYSTHATVSGLTWRYVVGVQLSSDYNVTTRDLAISGAASYVSYQYDEAVPGFRPRTASDVLPVAGASAVLLRASMDEMCATGPDFGVQTRCFPFQLHAVAPVAPNGWALTGETGKFVPVSNQRIASIAALAGGGFALELKGAPGEEVTMGAVHANAATTAAPVYAKATIGADGTAKLEVK
jgi:hypothetical protein